MIRICSRKLCTTAFHCSKESDARTVSIEDQRVRIEDCCRAQGWTLAEVVTDDVVSGGRRERLERLAERVKAVTGRKGRLVNVVDAFSRKWLGGEVETSLPGARVVQVLDRVAELRGRPEEVVLDNGPEFVGRAGDQWAYTRGVRLHGIDPGRPVQNAHIERVHGRVRDECLNESWFLDVPDARRIIAAWGQDSNTVRPHSALGYMTPEEYEPYTLTRAQPGGLST